MENIVLREYAYFDRQKVEDFLSTIEDGIIRESTEIERRHDGKIRGEGGIKGFVSIGGEKGYGENELQKLKTSTDASLFQRLYTHLNNQNMINCIDSFNEKSWKEVKVGDMLQINANVEFSALDKLIDTITLLKPIMEIDPNNVNSKNNEAIVGFQTLSQLSSKEGFNVKITPLNSPKFKLVSVLPHKNIKVTKTELSGQYNIICRVQKILNKNEKFELFKLIPGLNMNRKMLRDFLKNFKNMPPILGPPPKVEDLQVGYPAMIITPIVIYR